MRKYNLKRIASSSLAISLLLPSLTPIYAVEGGQPISLPAETNIRDHWNFEDGAKSIAGDRNTGTLHGITIADTGSKVFGKALKFGDGADKYMRLNEYMDSGFKQTTYSMWYKYDTDIVEKNPNASAILLQHEDKGTRKGRTILSLTADGKYDTYINEKAAPTSKSVDKSQWQHITIVLDQDTHKIKYYINGELSEEKDLGTNKTMGQRLSLRVGAHKQDGMLDPHPMRGYVDELYVYKRALTADEAKGLYADKGIPLLKEGLNKLIDEAESLMKDNALSEDKALLKSAIDKAKDVVSKNDLDALKTSKNQLKSAIEVFKAKKPIDLNIDMNKVNRVIDADSIFGINHRFAFNGYGTFDSKTMKVKDDFKKLYQDANFGSIRYPGGTISNLFNWKTTLGDKQYRKNQIHGFYNTTNNGKDQGGIAPNFGIGEIATFADEVDSEIVYVYSLGRGNAQDAADLIEYLNAKVGTNPNGGIDWAEVRARNGHVEPYNVRYFEIGNEMNQGGEDGKSSQQYWTSYVGKDVQDAYIDGGIASFDKKYAVKEEDWHKVASQSDGSKNQVRYLRYANTNPGKLINGKIQLDPSFKAMEQGVEVFVGTDQDLTKWRVVDDITQHGNEKVCEVDYVTGAIKFGDGIHGMIPEKGKNIYATYKVKREGYSAIAKAMKDTTEKINKLENKDYQALVYTSYESHDFFNKMKNRNQEDLYDGMTIHPYSDTVSGADNSAEFYDNAMYRAEAAGIKKVTDLVQYMPKGKVPVISEYGIFRNTEEQLRSQTHAVYIAKVLMEYVRLGSPYIQKHCLVDWYSEGADTLGPTQQAVIQAVEGQGADRNTGEGEYSFFSTPSAHVFKMLNSGFGDYVLDAKLSEVPHMNNGVTSLSTMVSKDDQGNLYIAIVNVDREHDRNIKINIDDLSLDGRKMSIQRLSTPSFTSANTKQNPNDVNVTYDETITLDNNPIVKVDKHSFVMVKIGSVDKSALASAIEKAEALNGEYYINFNAVSVALKQAKEVYSNDKATQTQVDEVTQLLMNAINGLELKDADYSEVDKAIDKASQLHKDDYQNYNKVEEAINKVVRGKKINEQSLVDQMAQAINDAMASLIKVEKPTPPQGTIVPSVPQEQAPQQSVDTSDSTNIIAIMTMMALSTIGFVFVKKKMTITKE